MNRFLKKAMVVCPLLAICCPLAYALDFPVPDFFELSVVAEDMSYSGVALSVSRFNSSRNVTEIRRFYEHQWPETRAVESDDLFVLSHLDVKDGLLYSVQIQSDWRQQTTPEGYLSVSNLPAILTGNKPVPLNKGKGFPVHITGTVINDMVFHDGLRNSRFLYLTHTANARTIYDHYQTSLKNRGWSVLSADLDKREHKGIVRLQKGAKRMDITLSFNDSETQMTAVELN